MAERSLRRRFRPRRRRPGLRLKLMGVSLVLIFIPLTVVWSVGLYEQLARSGTERAVHESAQRLVEELRRRPPETLQHGGEAGWLELFAHREHLMVRVLDREGQILRRTSPQDADRWSALRDWMQRAAFLFYGTAGPPDLLAFEAALPPEAERPEVRQALAGQAAGQWRISDNDLLIVYYHAVPLPGGQGALYLTRLTQRNIRALYGLRYPLLSLTLLLAFVAAALGLWAGWRLVSPLAELQRRIDAYLSPGGRPEPLPALQRQDEIGDLSRGIGELAQRLDQRLQDTARAAAELAHDLKNPLSTVQAVAERLLDGEESAGGRPLSAERQLRLGRALAEASAHMGRSVEGMLKLARLDESLASTARGPVDLGHLIRERLARCREDPARAAVAFTAALPPGPAWVQGVAHRLDELLVNLLDNALQHGATRIRCGLEPDPEGWCLTVADDGPGVSTGNREQIFRRFFSLRPEGAPPGTGLGLSIVRTIAEAHGGSVELLEEGPLPGACFALRLPAPEPGEEVEHGEQQPV